MKPQQNIWEKKPRTKYQKHNTSMDTNIILECVLKPTV